MSPITKERLEAIHLRMRPFVHNTPVLTSATINRICDAQVYFKCENFQKMGAFKMRGALNAILSLPESEKKYGVVTHSSGNFAQAVSLAAKNLQVPAYIVMPETAPTVKKEAVLGYGGQITECIPTLEAREQTSKTIMERTGATFIHPSNDMDVILGNATTAMELIEVHPDLDWVVCPVGGGGLIAGTALAVNTLTDSCSTWGGEPLNADDAYRSMISGKIETNTDPQTIADGLKTQLGHLNFPIIQEYVSGITRVSETEIKNAMRLLWERMKIVVEPSSAVALAAILKETDAIKGKKVGIILSGGNVDLGKLPFH